MFGQRYGQEDFFVSGVIGVFSDESNVNLTEEVVSASISGKGTVPQTLLGSLKEVPNRHENDQRSYWFADSYVLRLVSTEEKVVLVVVVQN